MHKSGRVRMRPCEDRGEIQDTSGQSSWLSSQCQTKHENSTCGQAERTQPGRCFVDQGMGELHAGRKKEQCSDKITWCTVQPFANSTDEH